MSWTGSSCRTGPFSTSPTPRSSAAGCSPSCSRRGASGLTEPATGTAGRAGPAPPRRTVGSPVALRPARGPKARRTSGEARPGTAARDRATQRGEEGVTAREYGGPAANVTAGDQRRVEVPEGLDGERLDAALARMFGLSRAAAADLVTSGNVLVDGRPAAKSQRVPAGEWLEVTLPPPTASPAAAQP